MGKLTVSLPLSLLAVLDTLARQWGTTRSGAVAELSRQTGQQELEQELAEGYVAWAEKNKRDSEREFFKDLKRRSLKGENLLLGAMDGLSGLENAFTKGLP